MDNTAIIEINGYEFYVANDQVDDLAIVDGYLVNTSSNTINAYKEFRQQGVSQTYPYISASSISRARYIYGSQSTQWSYITDFEIVKQPLTNTLDSTYILFIILGVLICQLFKH